MVQVAREHGCAWMIGLHPWWADSPLADSLLERLEEEPLPHGLGECGLDYVRARDPHARERQIAALRRQLAIAVEREIPVALHCVRAWHDLYAELRVFKVRGLIHAWTGSAQQTREVLRLGLHVSVGPDVLRSSRARAGLAEVPLERLLLESDAPDRPVPGAEQGEPAHVSIVASAVAQSRGESVSTVLSVTGDNARRLLDYSSSWASS